MGKKKDKLKAKALAADGAVGSDAADAKEKVPAADAKEKTSAASHATKAVEANPENDADAENEQHREDVYSAAAVVFFTRDDHGAVAQALVALEERKVSGSFFGLEERGKVMQRMLLFPMGRREKKDKNDAVETAKREYIEETGDYGGLSKYLDFADFDAEEGEASSAPQDSEIWSGKGNMAIHFSPARMIVLFCEVPVKASKATHHAAHDGKAISGKDDSASVASAAPVVPDVVDAGGEPSKKKRKKGEPREAMEKPSHHYHVGQTDHLDPKWIDASMLRTAMKSTEKAPTLEVAGEERRIFPTVASVLRLAEVRAWLGIIKEA